MKQPPPDKQDSPIGSKTTIDSFVRHLASAIKRRERLVSEGVQAFRVFGGLADGMDGFYIDVYKPGAVLNVYEGRVPHEMDLDLLGARIFELLAPLGVTAIYYKPFAKDRSRLGGELPEVVTQAKPLVGEALPEAIIIQEHTYKLEIRLYDGLSTGLFLDQRANRGFVQQQSAEITRSGRVPRVLNTFAYTCAFSIAAAVAGAETTSVDVSARYLEWGKRNFAHNGLDATKHRFAKMDTFEFFDYAKRKGFTYDLIILDPPSFSTGSKKKGVPAWSSIAHYARLVQQASTLLAQGGVVLASTNTQELCVPRRLEREVSKGLGITPAFMKLPARTLDFSQEKERFAAVAWKHK
jgi:23S rRNA (cytosine1962-C5)-methyltransferase